MNYLRNPACFSALELLSETQGPFDVYIEALNTLCKLDDHVEEEVQHEVEAVAGPHEPVVNEVGEDLVVGNANENQGHDGNPGDPGDQGDQGGQEVGGGQDLVHEGDGNGLHQAVEGDEGGNEGGNHAGAGEDVGGNQVGSGDNGGNPGDAEIEVGGHGDGGVDKGEGGDASASSTSSASDQVEEETLESLSENHGPLANTHMPTSSVLIKGSLNIASLHPWRLDLFDPNNTVRFSIPEKYHRIVSRRREVVSKNYRSGRMYAILHDGRIAMSPDKDIKVFLDAQIEKRGRSITVAAWLEFVKASVIRQKELQIARGTKRKYKCTVSAGKSAKETAKGTAKETAKATATETRNPFNMEDLSDDDTEEET